jgi:16S rRNA (guanine527-N7)-methyltransferase
MTAKILDDSLPAALARHQIELPDDQVSLLDRYARLLWEWNEKLNLTRHTDYERFVGRDVVDSLAFSRFLEGGERVLDVGTGGGVPGVILAIVRPDVKVSMCESMAKKARVVADVLERLELKAKLHHARAETLLQTHRYETLAIRAVAPLRTLLEWFKPHFNAFGRMLVLKGPAWVEERGEARHVGLMHGVALRKLASFPLPGTENESVLLSLSPTEDRHAKKAAASKPRASRKKYPKPWEPGGRKPVKGAKGAKRGGKPGAPKRGKPFKGPKR